MQPIRVSFDTNAYSPVTRPQLGKIVMTGWWPLTRDRILSKKRRLAWWYIQWCIRRGRILLQKSFWDDERKFLEPLMRFACGDVRGRIATSKIDHESP
jgi:hypothetical protein